MSEGVRAYKVDCVIETSIFDCFMTHNIDSVVALGIGKKSTLSIFGIENMKHEATGIRIFCTVHSLDIKEDIYDTEEKECNLKVGDKIELFAYIEKSQFRGDGLIFQKEE